MIIENTNQSGVGQSTLTVVKNYLITTLPDNFDNHDIEVLEREILDHLNTHKRIRGVVLDFTRVTTTDEQDLRRLQNCLLAARLLGRQIAFCGINPGLAALIIRSGQNLHHNLVGQDIDDVLKQI